MLFGATPFSNSPFADPGGISVQVLPTGERVDLATGNVQVVLGQTVLVTGEELALATDTVDVISWNPIIPGATGVWIPIDPDNP
jgi:hypothetical protein